jgi:dihydropyrimidinase
MNVDHNLFEGMTVWGVPVAVWVRGWQVVDGERFAGIPGTGQYRRRKGFGA